ncbi:MAG: LptE family protein [Lentimicrobiaceae bacterium]|nr:LptE family protein [Lentimicrobiaceae bacterium]
MKRTRTYGSLMVVAAITLMVQACGIYSFTGASIPPAAKTISILNFPNNAPLVQPTLSQTFTTALIDRFSSQTSLSIVPRDGDLHIEGEITGYSTQPVAILSTEQAAQNRLTITVAVRFINEIEPEKSFEASFSRFLDYPSTLSLSAIEEGLIRDINEALVDDIFNKAVVNW